MDRWDSIPIQNSKPLRTFTIFGQTHFSKDLNPFQKWNVEGTISINLIFLEEDVVQSQATRTIPRACYAAEIVQPKGQGRKKTISSLLSSVRKKVEKAGSIMVHTIAVSHTVGIVTHLNDGSFCLVTCEEEEGVQGGVRSY